MTPTCFNIKGKGNSIWGESKGLYRITQFEVNVIEVYDDTVYCSVSVYGPKTAWYQYTDSDIPRNLKKCELFMHLVKESIAEECEGIEFPKRMNVHWSEQGMQPQYGWNLEIMFKYKNK